jgi:indole-3-glycerol phosphate synthase
MNILQEIIEYKKLEVASSKNEASISQLKDMPEFNSRCISLRGALEKKDVAVIAEIKKASPSKGIICENFNPVETAREYISGGAAAISVLTDKKYFQGDIRYIADVRAIVPVPILRKDFIIDSFQLTEAKAFGADAVLLIAAALEQMQLKELHIEAEGLGLECLVEIHNEQELQTLDLSNVKIIGINNRNLSDFSVNISTSLRLASQIPAGITVVSESGISTRADIEQLLINGIHAVLIGESLMRQKNPGTALQKLLQGMN